MLYIQIEEPIKHDVYRHPPPDDKESLNEHNVYVQAER
jgi:hypothetical protein